MTSPIAPNGPRQIGFGHKLLLGIAVTLSVVMTLVALFSNRGLYQFYRVRQERLRLEQENARLALENDRLARTIDRLQHDPEFIQDLIRQELNFVRQNEIIFQFPPQKPGPPGSYQAAGEDPAPVVAPRAEAAVKGKGKRTAENTATLPKKRAKSQPD